MNKVSLVAKNYAKALFKLAKNANKIDETSVDLDKFARNFTVDLSSELKNPAISTADLLRIVAIINERIGISGLTSDFLNVLFKNRKISYFQEVYREFTNLVKDDKNILQIEVITAKKIDEKSLEEIKKIVAKQNQGKEIEILQTLKTQILGGIQIKIGSNLIDASIKSQLDRLENELLGTVN